MPRCPRLEATATTAVPPLVQGVMAMMWYWGGGVHWWEWLVGAFLTLAFWAAVVWLGWYVISGLRRPQAPPAPPTGTVPPAPADGARRILDERLARGEIDAEEYRRLREVLQEHDGERVGGTAGRR